MGKSILKYTSVSREEIRVKKWGGGIKKYYKDTFRNRIWTGTNNSDKE